MEKKWKQWQDSFSWAPKSLWMVAAAMKLKYAWKKSNDKPRQCFQKQRHYFSYKGPCRQSYDFSNSHVQMWEVDNKKAECQRIDDFELYCWWSLLRVPWKTRRSNQSILKEINPEYSLEGLMLKLKPQYFGHSCKEPTHWKRLWCWERLKVEGEGDKRGWDGWMASLTQLTWVWANSRR